MTELRSNNAKLAVVDDDAAVVAAVGFATRGHATGRPK